MRLTTSFIDTRGVRYPSPDAAHGFMLLLVALANIPFWIDVTHVSAPSDAVDTAQLWAHSLLVDSRAYSLFTVLFDFGLAAMVNRHIASGAAPYLSSLPDMEDDREPTSQEMTRVHGQTTVNACRLAWRRDLWMILFGVVHAVLFSGDIIGPYGSVVVIFTGWIARKHWKWALASHAVVVVAGTITFFSVGSFLTSQGASATDAHQGVDASIDTVLSCVSGGLLTQGESLASALLFSMIVPAMLLSARLVDADLIAHPKRHRRLLVTVGLSGLGFGTAGGIGFAMWAAGEPLVAWTIPLHTTTGVARACGWLALLTLYAGGPRLDGRLTGLRRLVSNVGRRSMTAHLSQTLLLAIIFMVLSALTGIELHLGEVWVTRAALAIWLMTVGLCTTLECGGYVGSFETLLRTAVVHSECRRRLPAPPASTTSASSVGTSSTCDPVCRDPGTQIGAQGDGERFPAGRRMRATTAFRDPVWWDGPMTAFRTRHRIVSRRLWIASQNARGHLSISQGIVNAVACLRPQL